MKTLTSISLALLSGLVITSCDFNEKSEFVQKHDQSGISGETVINNTQINFSVEAVSKTKSSIKVIVDGNILELSVDPIEEIYVAEGYNAVLTDEQKEALLALSMDLSEYINDTDESANIHELALITILEYWSQAPKDYVYSTLSFGIQTFPDGPRAGISSNEGITCIKKGATIKAQYDDRRGDHSDLVVVGSTGKRYDGTTNSNYGCMGRCGAGCGNSSVPSSWTKDCMDHDQCGVKNNSSGGAFDSNCGDEYTEAADDWSFGVAWGCNGK